MSEAGTIEEVEGHLLVLEKVRERNKKFARVGIITLLAEDWMEGDCEFWTADV